MSEFRLEPTGLGALATSLRDVASKVAADATQVTSRATGDLGPVVAAYDALVERFVAGLRTARGGVEQTSDQVDACLAEYAATDDDASVTFAELPK